MAVVKLMLEMEPTQAGIEGARRQLDEIERELFSGPAAGASVVSGKHDSVTLYEALKPGTLSRETLVELPAGDGNGMTPEELGPCIDNPWEPGTKPDKASVRGALRIIIRKQKKLINEGQISGDVLNVDWSKYEPEGAARYFIAGDARQALDEHLRLAG